MASKEVFYTLDEFDTEFPADSVEWCPAEPFRDVLACGTYKLIENKEDAKDEKCERTGRIYLLRVVDGGKLQVLQRIDTSGILDMKWTHVTTSENNQILLAVANSNGHLQIYELQKKENKTELQLIAKERLGDDNEDVMALSLDWSTGGFVSETCHLNPRGDDNKFLTFDARTGVIPVLCNREHTSGVTSIHSNAVKSFMLATGSYDEFLRLWDKRNLRRPVSKINLNGGIWRLKWDPFTHQYLLAACMYEDFKIINCDCNMSIIGNYNKHDGISYGCDWSFLKKEDVSRLKIPIGETLVSTCSYQDCALKLSAINLKIDELGS
ncbi:WD repeat-containing protein 85 [Camponotus floridanus]|uniref:methylated diphthine methylhydrolase n=1 Tax=Camponotus floridanus TaxID=104421 RepID=E2AWV2_CAMFO|nr:WD repeat-containing protein 85 [Camponotus floridanus]